MRLIDADALKNIKFHPLPYTHITPSDVDAESYKRGWNDAIDAIIEDAPTIEPEPCKDAVHAAYKHGKSKGIKKGLGMLKDAQPERKKGRWVYLSSVHGIDTSTRTYSYPFCSECGREHPVANFCPNCGADMRGET